MVTILFAISIFDDIKKVTNSQDDRFVGGLTSEVRRLNLAKSGPIIDWNFVPIACLGESREPITRRAAHPE